MGVFCFLYFHTYDSLMGESFPLSVLSIPCTGTALLTISAWFIKYGWLSRLGEEDYIRVRSEIRVLLFKWLALFAVQLITIASWAY